MHKIAKKNILKFLIIFLLEKQ